MATNDSASVCRALAMMLDNARGLAARNGPTREVRLELTQPMAEAILEALEEAGERMTLAIPAELRAPSWARPEAEG